jgi:hypothetical protein
LGFLGLGVVACDDGPSETVAPEPAAGPADDPAAGEELDLTPPPVDEVEPGAGPVIEGETEEPLPAD